jgi:hypothetical protein
MVKNFKELSKISQRSVYATLVCFMTCLISLIYYFAYSKNPLTLVALMPIILWIAYDGNEHEEAVKSFWYWIALLIITSIIAIIYPLF